LQENNKTQHECGATWIKLLETNELSKRFPWINMDGIDIGSYGTENEGYFDPWAFVSILKRDAVRDVSKIGYYISIDLELKKGSPLTPEEIGESKCTRKWNTVRKAFANFTGKTYTIPPVYDYSNKQTLKNKPNNKPNNVTRSNKPPPPAPQTQNQTPQTQTQTPPKTGGTRKNEIKHIYLNGKHNKTIKKL
jgi:hypothetical protein